MTIKTRLWLLLALLAAASVAMLDLLIRMRDEQAARDRHQEETALGQLVSRVVRYTNNQLYQFARDYRKWDELIAFVQHPDPAWARENIDEPLAGHQIHRVWILRADASLVYEASWPDGPIQQDAPAPASLLPVLRKRHYAYFSLRLPDGLYRVQAMPIVPLRASRTLSDPQGWLLFARRWDEAYLRQFGELCQSRIVVAEPGRPELGENDPDTTVRVRFPLKNPQGRTVAELFAYHAAEKLVERKAFERLVTIMFVSQGLIAIFLTGIFLRHWVSTPFARITESLATRDPKPIEPLLAQGAEFGRMAQLIKTSFADREALQRSLDERIRLGRDLHDGIVQSVFAAGMTLASTRPLVRDEPAEAERLIEETRVKLNAIIRDLRAYIAGTQPEAARPQAFSEAVAAVVEQMQPPQAARITLEIDDRLVGELPLHQRSQLLQIVRESVGNAFHHGRPGALHIRLQRADAGTRLEIADDGVGFEPAIAAQAGHGLANLAERARILGGVFTIDSAPGRGTIARVVFSPSVGHP